MSTSDELAMGLAAKDSGSESESDTRAAIYARTSSVSQQFGYSIEEQLRCCLDRCEMFGWSVTHVYRDEAKSGKDTDRPMFQRMLSHAEAGRFDVLVFWKLDRFSRSIMHAVQLEKVFRDWDVSLHSVTEQIDTTTAAGRFNFRNIANAAEFERELIKQRTQMGHTALALDHKWPNENPPLGYTKKDDGRLHVLDSEADLVEELFDSYIQIQSMPQVAHTLNANNHSTKANGEWTARAVGEVLRNQIYIGKYRVGQIEEFVPEYQILSSEKFQKVTGIRFRFQRCEEHDREQMPKDRKADYILRATQSYSDFL